MSELIIVRGLPGSGKSTLARFLVAGNPLWHHYEADQYFLEDGVYKFDREKLHLAYLWCVASVTTALSEGFSVVVSNTFTTNREMKPYIDFARENSIPITMLTCEGNHGNIHDVPQRTIDRMKARWEPFN